MLAFDFNNPPSTELIDRITALRNNPPVANFGNTDLSKLIERLDHVARSGGGLTGRDFERIIGRNDLLPINYLARGSIAAKAVGRVHVAGLNGEPGGFGTGFLIAPNLMMTNNHVIASVAAAKAASIEFSYELGIDGQLATSRHFRLAPEIAFITSPQNEFDYTIVGVQAFDRDGVTALTEYGFLRLVATTNKIRVGEAVSIIQHPNGEEKYLAIRENNILQIGADGTGLQPQFIWYATDTEPGSSGSPTLNDQWQVVALHHSGVPSIRRNAAGEVEYQLADGDWVSESVASKLSDRALKWIANEGIRVSAIVANLRKQQATMPFAAIQALIDDIDGVRPFAANLAGQSFAAAAPRVGFGNAEFAERVSRQVHAPEYFADRTGYDPRFLGTDIALPGITSNALRFGSVASVIGNSNGELKYTHFSVVMNATRRLAFFTAVNIDGAQSSAFGRNSHPWFFDGRLDLSLQVDDDFYGNEPSNFFDRGHLVRRLDPVWGDSATLAIANSDTFHWTNCSPQHKDFNQSQALWQGLENFILGNANTDNLRASVFTGPVFRVDDGLHRNVQIPQSFWKVVVVADVTGKLFSSAYEVSQQSLVQNIGFERLPVGAYKTFQVSIAALEQKTGLQFAAAIRNSDVMAGAELARPLQELANIQLPQAPKPFGQFANAGEFLASYTAARNAAEDAQASAKGLEFQLERGRRQRERDVVEIEAIVVENQGVVGGGQGKHQHMLLKVKTVVKGDPDVTTDVQRVLDNQETIFLAIRVGDNLGLARPVPNVKAGDQLKLQGEWITKEKAYNHGGEQMSVLHFTHHPLGFVCDAQTCYQ